GSAQCYNCHTTATPLWRKDEEGKTVCNASVLLSPLLHNMLISYIYTDATCTMNSTAPLTPLA
ncbi:hypothetical protein CY34DRAFT_102132, partial [Suillus luteus UH-Slu-Lm8-n1]